MTLNSRFLLFFLIFIIIISCKTNKMPPWVNDPPPDDDLNIYIVGIGKGDDVYDSVINQIYERFNIPRNDYFTSLISSVLKNDQNEDILIVDKWSSSTLDYILVRIKRSFFDPIKDLYLNSYNEMLNYQNDNEIEADLFFKDGEMYSSYKSYIKALEFMLNEENEFYSPSILNVISKIKEILNSINYYDLQTFSTLTIKKAIVDKSYSFRVSESDETKYNGFIYKVNFTEGFENRKRFALIPIRNNSCKFVPPIPVNSGVGAISSNLYIEDLVFLVNKWKSGKYLGDELSVFYKEIESIIQSSTMSFSFEKISDIRSFTKVISFDNKIVSEGILRYLLEYEDDSVLAPVIKGEESNLVYVREINSITDSLYRYLILGDEIKVDITPFDEAGIRIQLKCLIHLIDLDTSVVIQSNTVSSEFVGTLGDEELAYLDFGLKIGEVIYDMKF